LSVAIEEAPGERCACDLAVAGLMTTGVAIELLLHRLEQRSIDDRGVETLVKALSEQNWLRFASAPRSVDG
jgi:hypothetical protein